MSNPLFNKTFLHELDKDRNRVIYTRITSLTQQQYGVECIEGVVTGGSITIDGSSTVRRICSLTLTTKNLNINSFYWSLTTKVKIELGLKNRIDSRYDDIIWFPQGVFILTEFNTQQQVNNYIITLSGKDKMCLLNGDIGGVFTNETDCGKIDYQDTDGTWRTKDLPLKAVIENLVHHYGGENFENILIKDLDQLALRDYRNNTRYKMYLIKEISSYNYDNYVECLFYNTTLKSKSPEVHFGYIPEKQYYYKANENWLVDFNQLSKYFTFVTKKEVSEDDDSLLTVSTDDYESATKIFYRTYEEVLKENMNYTPSATYYTYNEKEDEYTQLELDLATADEVIDQLYTKGEHIYIELQHDCILIVIDPNETIGYKVQEIYYPDDLIGSVGSTITSIFDKILEQFPDFEYFYNLKGQFVFQRQTQYTQSAWNNIISHEDNEYYVNPDQIQDYVEYVFDDNKLAISHQNTPKLSEIKNDFTIWGQRAGASGNNPIPIHARYAIDLKPNFYHSFDGYLFTTDKDLYAKSYFQVENQLKNLKPNGVPACFEDKVNWWNVLDWQDYYYSVTDKYPEDPMWVYQAENNLVGFKDRLYFPDPVDYDLIVAFEERPLHREDREPNVMYLGTTGGFIVDLQSEGEFAGYPVGWEGWADPNDPMEPICGPLGLYNAFMHRYNGCGHRYTWFLDKAERFHYSSYVYRPVIPKENIVHADKLIDFTPIFCDWREIIFQMAKDYFKYGQTDEYAVRLRVNNCYSEVGIELYMNGHTGYEQYYTDLEAFWRELYCPVEFLEKDNFIINSIVLNKNDYFLHGDFAGWNKKVINDPASLIFWFDFFDANAYGLNQYAVPAIGSRPIAEKNDQISQIVNTNTPNAIFITQSDYNLYASQGRLPDPGAYHYFIYSDEITYWEKNKITQQYPIFKGVNTVTKIESSTQVNQSITNLTLYVDYNGNLLEKFNPITHSLITQDSTWYSAQEYISNMLYQYAYAHETITITGVPIYYLEPNTIISARDELHIINGYYILNKIVLPLQAKGTMQLTAIRVPERVY